MTGPGKRRGSAPAARPDPRRSTPGPLDDDVETQRILSLFGQNTRAGYWEPPERLEVMAMFGGVKLDFRDANLYSGVTVVNCLAMFGGIDIIVSPDLEIDANGTGLFGGFEHKPLVSKKKGLLAHLRGDGVHEEFDEEYEVDPDAEPPLLKIRGLALFGGVTVRVRSE